MPPTCAFSLVTKLQSMRSWNGRTDTITEEGSVCCGGQWRPSHESQEADGRNVLSCHTCRGLRTFLLRARGGGGVGWGGVEPSLIALSHLTTKLTAGRKYSYVRLQSHTGVCTLVDSTTTCGKVLYFGTLVAEGWTKSFFSGASSSSATNAGLPPFLRDSRVQGYAVVWCVNYVQHKLCKHIRKRLKVLFYTTDPSSMWLKHNPDTFKV